MSERATELTRNQTLVLNLLRSNSGSLTAYQILDQLKGQGITAPPTVYRALTRLTSVDFVHRIDSLNAYVACDQSCIHSKPHDGEAAFAICQDCGDVAELEVAPALKRIEKTLDNTGFTLSQTKVELIGVCRACSENPVTVK